MGFKGTPAENKGDPLLEDVIELGKYARGE